MSRQSSIDFQTLQAYDTLPQPICGHTGTRSDFEDCVAQFDAIEPPSQYLVVCRPLPAIGLAVPAMKPIHRITVLTHESALRNKIEKPGDDFLPGLLDLVTLTIGIVDQSLRQMISPS